ncbi:MAG: carboxymuconolactone decarboxylase family protein [Thalassobaculaceae bacterium]
MAKDYKEIAADLTSSMGRLQKGIPDTMKGFAAMGAAAKASGALDAKTKELIAIAIAVAVRCDGCIAAHTKAAEQYGVDREEILETLSMAVYMGGGPSVVYASQALDSFDAFSTQSD